MNNIYKATAEYKNKDNNPGEKYIRIIKSDSELVQSDVEDIISKNICYKIENGDSIVIQEFEKINQNDLDKLIGTVKFTALEIIKNNNCFEIDDFSIEHYDVK